MNKKMKGQALAGIPSAALYIGIAVFVVALLITVLATYQTTQFNANQGTNCTNAITDNDGCGAAFNATGAGITGLATFNDFWGVLVLIVILAIVITALYAVFPRRTGY